VAEAAPQRYAEANRLFAALLELAPERRDTEAQARCGDDAALLALVRRLLAHSSAPEAAHEHTDPRRGELWRSALERLAAQPTLACGDTLGPYRLLRRVGHGGSAEVYLAERRHEGVVQQVAIKLLLAEAVDAVGLARFRQEQQILARLNHPHIGKIFDLGESGGGRPYFVMEFVDGVPIDQFCDRQRLDLRQRLRLFLQVADAVAHAHGELVVHRDIKPSNVLVDAHGTPKLVDFGIAKVLDTARNDAELTQPGRAPATVGYASPEQLAGAPVGVASDVYQLGMLAYVLLAGQRPHARRGLSAEEAAHFARGQRLIAPSEKLRQLLAQGERDRVGAIADTRRTRVDRLLRGLHGDIDQVVLKAIAAEPGERYASVPQFADDVRNALASRPVAARPPSLWYVFSRTVRRHAVLSSIIGVLVLGLVAFSIAVGTLALRLDQARQRAEQQSQLADRVIDFLLTSFREAEPERGGDEQSLVRRALDRAAEAREERFGDDPAFTARLHLVLGRAYETLYETGIAQREYERALEIARTLPPRERTLPEYQALNALARARMRNGDVRGALQDFERVVELTADDPGALALHASALANIGTAWHGLDDIERALDANARAIEAFARVYGPDQLQSIRVRLARIQLLGGDARYSAPQRLTEAAAIAADLVPRAVRTLGERDETTLVLRLLQHRLQAYRGEHEAAVRGLQEVLPLAAGVLGENDLPVAAARTELGVSLARLGHHDAGLEQIERAIAALRERFGEQHPTYPHALFDRALAQALAGREREAAASLAQADPQFLAHEPVLLRLQASRTPAH
jgi:eukaryotic-like serine/threonine-protein kinase